MKFIFLVLSFFARYSTAKQAIHPGQACAIIAGKEAEIRLLEAKIEQLQQEITHKDRHMQELTQSNNDLAEKLSKVLSDLSTSIHLN